MSTKKVSAFRWRLALTVLLGVVFVGSVLLAVLSLGAANPPRGQSVYWQANSLPADWRVTTSSIVATYYRSAVALPVTRFTIELTATNNGNPDSAWGLWLQAGDSTWSIAVDAQGYLILRTGSAAPTHTQFRHLRPKVNTISLDVQTDGSAVLRLNSEIAWTGELGRGQADLWGVMEQYDPVLKWESLRIFAD